MSDPFSFDPMKLTWGMHPMDDGRHALRTIYSIPGGHIGNDYFLDAAVLADPLQISGIIGTETRRVILSFQNIVAGLSSHEKLRWIAAARAESGT